MSGYLYDQGQIQAAIRRSECEARSRPQKRVNEAADIEPTRNIPIELYLNAVRGHGVDPNDFEYWKDMERVCPSIKIDPVSGKIISGPSGLRSGRVGKLTRHGRVTWSKRYV